MAKPERLFHLTRPSNEASIREKGLLRSAWGETYFCESVEDCLRIIGSRIAVAFSGQVETKEVPVREGEEPPINATVDAEGRWWVDFPVLEQNTHALLVEVDVKKMHAGSLRLSNDHNPAFFKNLKSWAYYRDLPPSALTLSLIELEPTDG